MDYENLSRKLDPSLIKDVSISPYDEGYRSSVKTYLLLYSNRKYLGDQSTGMHKATLLT
jgi:hypothetical protein